MEIANATGTLELRAEAPRLRVFVEDTFRPLHRTKFRPGTWRRYQGLLRQGLLDELGDTMRSARRSSGRSWPRWQSAAIALAAFAGLPQREVRARHYFLTALVHGGANLEAVRELAGHSKLHTTQRYVHAAGADLTRRHRTTFG